jgi:hypothetical protein
MIISRSSVREPATTVRKGTSVTSATTARSGYAKRLNAETRDLEESALTIDSPHDAVRGEDHDETHDGLVQPCGASRSEVAALHPEGPEDVRVDDIRGLVEEGIALDEIQDQAEIAVEDPADCQEAEREDRRDEERQGDARGLDPAVPAVDLHRLVESGVDAMDRGQVDDRTPSQPLPDVGAREDGGPEVRPLVPGDRLEPEEPPHGVQVPDVCGEEVVRERPYHDPRDEVGKEHERLAEPLECRDLYLVEENRKEHLGHRAEEDEQDVQPHRVEGDAQEVAREHEKAEVPQPAPGASEDPVPDVVILEGDDDARHGQVAENDEEEQAGQRHEVDRSIPGEVPQQPGSGHSRLDRLSAPNAPAGGRVRKSL